MKNDMIIYCADEHEEVIQNIRKHAAPESRTEIVTIDFKKSIQNLKPIIESIQKRPEYIKLVDDPRMPEYWNAEYVLVNYMKTDFVVDAIERGYITTDLVAWLDFGYVRGSQGLPKNLIWDYDFDSNKMHYFNKLPIDFQRPIFDIVKTNTVYVMGCHIVGGIDAWKKHRLLNRSSLNQLIACGLVDDDQTIMLMNYKSDQELFELHPIKVEQEEWFNWNVSMIKFNKETEQ